jgi:hypothetical protein
MTPAEQWEQDGRLVAVKRENSIWEMAWWLVEGQMKAFDAGFSVSSRILKRDKKTLENYYRVGLAWPRGTQHPDLAFTTHRELLRERDPVARALVMSEAIEHGWFADDVTRYFEKNPPSPRPLVGMDRPPSSKNRTPYQRRYQKTVMVKCPCGCGHIFPVKGNKVSRDAVATEVAEGGRQDARGREAEPADVPVPGSGDSGGSGDTDTDAGG